MIVLDIRVLGPTRIITPSRIVSTESAMVNTVLFALACHHSRPVSTDLLCDLLWDDPPAHSHTNIRNYIHQLRSLLGTHELVRTYRSGGGTGAYALMVEPHQVDALRFTAYLHSAKIAAHHNNGDRACQLSRAAIDCWSGDLIGLPHTRALHTLTTAWDRARVEAVELHITAALDIGRLDSLDITDMAWHAITHPYRQRAQALLQRALQRRINGAA